MRPIKRIRWGALKFLLLVLTACGGGLDNDANVGSSATSNPNAQGFVDTTTTTETQAALAAPQVYTELPSELPPGTSVGACNQQNTAGTDTPVTVLFQLGRTSGTLGFSYQTYFQQDRMFLYYAGSLLFDSGCVGTSTLPQCPGGVCSTSINFSGNSSILTVQVQPNCAGGVGTAWNFTVTCP